MKRMTVLSLFLALVIPVSAETPGAEGFWKGAIELPGGSLEIAVSLEPDDGVAWSGTIDIPAQGLSGFALSAVTVEGSRVHFEMGGVPGTPTFDGTLGEDGEMITGSFRQGQAELTFSLERATEESKTPEGPSLPEEPVPGEGLAGDWMGKLDVGPMQLRLALKVSPEDGGFSAIVDSVDQGSKIPVDRVVFEERNLVLEMNRIGASFDGVMNGDGSAIEGTWTQGGRTLPLTLHRLAEPFALKRPQNPEGPFPYESREVSFENEAADIRLAGTLLIPEGEGPFPAVVFVTGSGPQDRDESLMGHKPFLVIADFLARRGIASLRYDDRGVGKSGGSFAQSTVRDFASDLDAGVAFLAVQKEVDSGAIGILGHSEGGLSGPMVATTNEAVDFLVLLAPPGERLDALLRRQARDVLTLTGALDDELLERALAMQAEDIALIMDESIETDALGRILRERAEERRKGLTDDQVALLQLDEGMVEMAIEQATGPWFRSLLREDPASYLETIKIPVLALFGGKDVQVAADVNAAAVEVALKKAGNEHFEVRILPGLNHLFQHAETGAPAEYGTIEETVAPEVLELIAAWISDRRS